MRRRTPKKPKPTAPTATAPADWRAEAEGRGREAFESIHVAGTAADEPQPTPEPLAWLWTPPLKGKKESR